MSGQDQAARAGAAPSQAGQSNAGQLNAELSNAELLNAELLNAELLNAELLNAGRPKAESGGAAREPANTVVFRLRQATAAAHAELEASLGLLNGPPARGVFVHLLERFLGFYVVFEPSLRSAMNQDAFLIPRLKQSLLRDDLARLGHDAATIAALPRCAEAAGLAGSRAAALGALYVVEGSTLGGQVIARHLAKAAWLPAEGLDYFAPYGARTGAMWRETLALLEAEAGAASEPAMLRGAVACFALLRDWLAPSARPASRTALAAPLGVQSAA